MPFCRVDPLRPGAARAMDRAAAGGAVGLKLHPVAQRFRPEHPDAAAVVRDATARGWPVTIHAGFGARPLAGPIAALLDAAPGARLMLAHGGRGDARALGRLAAERAGILFDTSLAALADLVALPPALLVFGSDRPYGEHGTALRLVARAAVAAGWSEDDLAGVIGGNLRRLLAARMSCAAPTPCACRRRSPSATWRSCCAIRWPRRCSPRPPATPTALGPGPRSRPRRAWRAPAIRRAGRRGDGVPQGGPGPGARRVHRRRGARCL